jgi:hypothetical protein
VDEGGADPDAADRVGSTALHTAAARGHAAAAQALLALGAAADVRTRDGESAADAAPSGALREALRAAAARPAGVRPLRQWELAEAEEGAGALVAGVMDGVVDSAPPPLVLSGHAASLTPY